MSNETQKDTLGQSEIKVADLNDKKVFLQGLVDKDLLSEEISNFLYYAIAPKGHKDHASILAAAIQCYPTVNPATVKNQALKQILNVFQNIFHAEDVKVIAEKKAVEKEEKQAKKGSLKPRLPIEDRAKRMATSHLSAQFRNVHKLPDRGKFSLEMAEKYKVYLEDKLPKAVEKFTKDLESKQKVKIPVPELA